MIILLYSVEFALGDNPPRSVDQFAAALRQFAATHGLDLGMSGLGGMACRRGDVRKAGGDVTEQDRHRLANWIRAQRVKCVARLGDLEIDDRTNELFREITEWVFVVDNLLPEDRQAAAAWRARFRGREDG